MTTAFKIKSLSISALLIKPQFEAMAEFQSTLQEYLQKYDKLLSMPFVLDLSDDMRFTPQAADQLLGMLKKHEMAIIALEIGTEKTASWHAVAKRHQLHLWVAGQHTHHKPPSLVASTDEARVTKQASASSNSDISLTCSDDLAIQLHQTDDPALEADGDNQDNRTDSAMLSAHTPKVNEALTRRAAVVIDKAVRSGQQIYAPDADLIITALVSSGAEVIADGHVHIYAPLRGRAIAGAKGDKTAKIFVHSMEAQLVAIAGQYRIFERDLPASLLKKSVTVALKDNKLEIKPIA